MIIIYLLQNHAQKYNKCKKNHMVNRWEIKNGTSCSKIMA